MNQQIGLMNDSLLSTIFKTRQHLYFISLIKLEMISQNLIGKNSGFNLLNNASITWSTYGWVRIMNE
ncbi:hypothetical protein BLA29_010299 [Euroglyphus maynei]|uniref:Uncharacterized protein n=1 Tax=Euroglyphus maynei TaxID=6958 RepID=A0A1Y3BLJ9_EURMA|nr:hypothetical protein BLA29_010299 [Euroglyphus maynei]